MILRDLAEVYAFMFFTGLGTYRLIVPEFLRTRALSAVLITGVGFAQFSIVIAYVIYTEQPISSALPVSVIVGALTFLVSLLGAANVLPRG